MDQKKPGFQPLALSLTVAAALLRLVPHPPNFAPIGGVALFGGAKLRGWQAYIVPLLAMLITDPIRSWMEGGFPAYTRFTPIIYSCFLISVLLGRVFLAKSPGITRIVSVALLGSLQFYGLVACYIAALPFFGRTVLADVFYTGVLFSVYALLNRRFVHEVQSA